MRSHWKILSAAVLCLAACALGRGGSAAEPALPAALEPWKDWATWDDRLRDCPAAYADGNDRMCFWPTTLALRAEPQGGSFRGKFAVFARCWVPLPGSADAWPANVTADGLPAPVFERDGRPSIELQPGSHEIAGEFPWDAMPEKVAVPAAVGLLTLEIAGQPAGVPDWDEEGFVWLRRTRAAETTDDALSIQVFRLIEDGIPLWLDTEIELTAAGKSREEELGALLPAGWKLATIDSPIPVAIDAQGGIKVQVRAGKWTLSARAFRIDDAREFRYEAATRPLASSELWGFRSNPGFRLAQLAGLDPIDASQTAYPAKWRDAPTYRWETDRAFQLQEKVRGMGLQRPEGLQIDRVLWLDAEGDAPQLTYRDRVSGARQQLWRLDAAEGLDLGRVRIGGEGQLITVNPQTGAHGVEIRRRDLQLEAIGKASLASSFSATGWRCGADALQVTLTLPPGWRALAVLGADRVDGDWLTAWSLLDLFLLLVFALAVGRLRGAWAGAVAFLGFGLSYHELGAPRLTWLLLLIPVAILATEPAAGARRWLVRWKSLAALLLLLNLVPFVGFQLQSALYPQLENAGVHYAPRGMFRGLNAAYRASTQVANRALEESLPRGASWGYAPAEALGRQQAEQAKISNLQYDPQARIQTGPAEPTWTWNEVRCAWDGPVSAEQRIRPVLVTLAQHRALTAGRVALLLCLVGILLGVRRPPVRRAATGAAVALAALVAACPPVAAAAEIPGPEMLKTLRERLLKPADAFPRAAEIAAAKLRVDGNRVSLDAEIHAALTTAVPLPGRLPAASPLAVTVDGQPADLVGRRDGYLWVVLPAGVHRVTVDGILPEVSDWAWTFLLRPRRVTIDAPEWRVSGVRPNGLVESQVLFERQRQAPAGEASYDRKDFQAVAAVDRYLEIGLIWQVRTEVTRLSAPGKATSLNIPLLPGERVLSADAVVSDGRIEVPLTADQQRFAWVGELPQGPSLALEAGAADAEAAGDRWVERWRLATSPMWNVAYEGLPPVYEEGQQDLAPVWHPWPGERVQLAFSRPQAVRGATVTAQQVSYATTLGSRQRAAHLKLDVNASLGTDFAIRLAPDVEIAALTVDGQTLQPRIDDDRLLVPLPPGRHALDLQWRTPGALAAVATVEPVELPVPASNIDLTLEVPESRWILWADGPLLGPAVRCWTILAVALLAACVLGSLPHSPLRRYEWVLLAIGLTQVHVAAALLVVGWLYLLAWRGRQDPPPTAAWRFNLQQLGVVFATVLALGVLLVVVKEGLLGSPEMFVGGNGSYGNLLRWFQPNADGALPQPRVASVSIWFYRLLMLAWALWLAAALLRWLQWGWVQFTRHGAWRRKPRVTPAAP